MEQKPNKKRWVPVILLATLLLALFLMGALPRLRNTKKIDALARENPLPRVAVFQIKKNENSIDLTLPSSAQAWHITSIWSRVNGYLIRYLVDIGDKVKAGDLLAEIDTPETDQQLLVAKAELDNSLAELNIAKITKERWDRLWGKNKEAVSKQEVDQYDSNYKSAEAIVVANEKTVARLTYEQQFKFIYAPFDGVITQRTVDIGALIYGNINGAPEELFQLAQTGTIRFFVEVPQTYFRQITEGVEAEVVVQEFPSYVFKGKVTRYAKALDPAARTMLTQVDVDNQEGLLYPGVYGKVTFKFQPDQVNFIIPTTSLVIQTGYPQIAVVDEDNTLQLKRVQIGKDYGKHLEITAGLQENDKIVTNPFARIATGQKVNVLPPK